jgi:hypothetical protein
LFVCLFLFLFDFIFLLAIFILLYPIRSCWNNNRNINLVINTCIYDHF